MKCERSSLLFTVYSLQFSYREPRNEGTITLILDDSLASSVGFDVFGDFRDKNYSFIPRFPRIKKQIINLTSEC